MEYRVEVMPRAFFDLDAIFAYINADKSRQALYWFNELEAKVFSLNQMPERGSRTREDSSLRQLLHGNKPHIFRIIYKVDRTNQTVLVLHIRHGAQDDFEPSDLLVQ